jgi:multiple sugar transport system substrate-binding protein
VSLSILAWDHPRAVAPLAACRAAWERLTGERLLITTRSLASFGDDVPEAGSEDLVLIDHPHVGRAAADGTILPLDGLLDDAALATLAADSAGPSHASYRHDGHHWAVAIDASCQALAVAASAEHGPAPATWDDVVALALAHPGTVALPLHPAHAISALLSMLASREQIAGDSSLASDEALQWATGTLATLAAAGPAQAFGWEAPDALGRLAEGDLRCVPIVYAYVGYDVAWRAAPAMATESTPGSILGGVGAAVLSGSPDPVGAARLAAWLGSSEIQLGLVRPAGGQPATYSAWTAPGADPMFEAVLPTLEMSQVRRRDAWWPAFQRASGELLARGLLLGREPLRLADELARLYHDHHEATQ